MQSLWKKVVADQLALWHKGTNIVSILDQQPEGYAPEQLDDFILVARTKTTQMLGRRFMKLSPELQLLVEYIARAYLGRAEGQAFVRELRRQAVL